MFNQLIKIGERCKLESPVYCHGEMNIGNDVIIGKNVKFDVKDFLEIGDRTVIHDNCTITGRSIKLGRECWLSEYAIIGGGNCFNPHSKLVAGDWLHMGLRSMINISREVTIGDEVGLGIDTKVYTHGGYLSYLHGFPYQLAPVKIGSHVWLPQAIVLPNVIIDDNVVVAAGSLVNKTLLSGYMYGGVPAKILKRFSPMETNFTPMNLLEDILHAFIDENPEVFSHLMNYDQTMYNNYLCRRQIFVDGTLFDFEVMRIDGRITPWSEKFKDHCRRWGVRFKYYPDRENGIYKSWE